MRTIKFFDGYSTTTAPTGVELNELGNYASDLDFAATVASVTAGMTYFNTTTNEPRYYDGTQWVAWSSGSGGSGLSSTNLNDVVELGIDNTGATDVTGAITTLLATYDSLYFPDGTYLVEDLNTFNDKTFWGTGTFVKGPNGERTLIVGSNVTIDGLNFRSTTTGVQRSEIKLNDGSVDITIRNCHFEGSIYSAISADINGIDDDLLQYANTAKNINIHGNKFIGYIRPIYLHSVEDVNITNNIFRNTLRDAVRLRQRVGVANISNNIFKDIGEFVPSIVERPANWISLDTYSLGDQVSVPPYGIYECIVATSTIGANPISGGSSEWTLIDGSYFETKDAVDTYWSGRELIIANNLIDGTASVGLDIKGSEPSGDYSTDSVIITGNLIKNTFGIGLNFHNSRNLEYGQFANEFRYVGNCIISNNIFKNCNSERYDVAQAAINIRQGTSNVSITNNHIKNHFGRAVNVLNLSEDADIQRSMKITGNQIIDCGLPGHAGNIGLNLSPIDGAIIKDNIIENTNLQPEYKFTVTGTPSSTNTLTIPTKVSRSDINVDLTGMTTAVEVLTELENQLTNIAFPDDPNPLLDIKYYGDVDVESDTKASAIYEELALTGVEYGSLGNDVEFELIHDNAIATGVNVGAVDVIGNVVRLTLRTSARANNALIVYNANKSAAGADALLELSLAPGTPTDTLSQAITIPTPANVQLSGGVDPSSMTFFARVPKTFENTTFPIVQDGVSIDLLEYPDPSYSVNKAGIIIRDDELVGAKTFTSGVGKLIIKDNIIRNNASAPRFEILYNGQEIAPQLAYVTSNNEFNNTVVSPLARTSFSGGTDSDGSNHLNVLAGLSNQGIILQARNAGAIGNNIHYRIEQPTTTDQILRVLIAPLTTINGYYIGGSEIIVYLPTDAVGAPVDATVAEVEAVLKTRLNQAVLVVKDNILS